MVLPALLVCVQELGPAADPLVGLERAPHLAARGLALRRDGQALAALGATALQDEASILRAHAFKEAMRLAAAAAIGLKSALHGSPGSP